MKRNVVRSLVALGTVSAACHDTPQLAVRTTNHDVPRMEQLPPDSLLARLVATVPGFGGLYLDETGRAAVYLRDVRQRAAADTVLAAYRPIRVLHGEYTYKELGGWFERLSPEVLGLFGVVLVDLDEAKNRLLVGVVDSTAAAAVRRVVAHLGLPLRAVVVSIVRPFHSSSGPGPLNAKMRPLLGGVGIDLDDNWAPGPSCTLGFNATITFWGQGIYSGRSVEERSFITASHCTRTQGGTEQTPFYQPDFPDNFVGTEVSDPPYTVLEVVGSDLNRHTCALNSVCRASDAARIAYAPGVPFHFSIARPRGFGTRSLEVVGELPIIAEGGIEIQGAPASKVGMRTGWTGGVIGMTCGDVTVLEGTHLRTLLCQNIVTAEASGPAGPMQCGGDSGSPVFWVQAVQIGHARLLGILTTINARLLGILWAGNDNLSPDCGTDFVYSPIANIEAELGPLRTSLARR